MVIYIIIAVIILVAAIIFYRKKREKKMPAGLQIFDENGNLVMDMTSRVSKILGTVTTNAVNGSLVDDRLLDGDLWVMIEKVEAVSQFDPVALEVKKSGSTLSWTHHLPWGRGRGEIFISGQICNIIFIYGIY